MFLKGIVIFLKVSLWIPRSERILRSSVCCSYHPWCSQHFHTWAAGGAPDGSALSHTVPNAWALSCSSGLGCACRSVVSASLRPHELYPHGQAPLSVGFSRQEHWSGLPCPPPGDLPHPGIEPGSPALQADSLPSEPPGEPLLLSYKQQNAEGSSGTFSSRLCNQLFLLWTPFSFLPLKNPHLLWRLWVFVALCGLLPVHCWASCCGGFSCCRPGAAARQPRLLQLSDSVVAAPRLSCPVVFSILPGQGLRLWLLFRQADSYPLFSYNGKW